MDLTILLIILGVALAVLFCMCLAIANYGPARFLDIFNEVNGVKVYGIYLQDFLNNVNASQFGSRLRIVRTDVTAGDAYARGGVLILSLQTLSQNSVASFATLAHELGHALQDRDGKKLKIKSILKRIGYFVSPLLFPALIAAIILVAIGGKCLYIGIGLASFGGFIFILSLVLKLFTISIEKDASKRAIVMLQDYLDKNQLKLAKKLLKSAKLSYWAVFFRTLLAWTFLTKKSSLVD